ncbi:hypothetical protein FB45DRAFT_737054 [Roridomyces roridus]|uniref:Yeast cell wall synthesis Kre9/Knh1-like N-terminal domain-containing protein n=1 Tax=Roridomyces roridus TaxID=1738132 RepID=A0AAD7FUG7_9AGAR|nr:hypothetical protein FB45DRAFT_737054 [Roridomyces roridus]
MSLYLASLFLTVVLGVPLEPRTVFAPPITSPTSTSVWKVGQVQTVTWNATGIPTGVQGKIQLGFLTEESENLSQILAEGFNLTDEKVNITVPDVVSRTNYIVVLFGDSGNISPKFTIQGGPASVSGRSSTLSASTAAASARSNTPSPPIATAPLSSAPQSTATAPGSASTSTSTSSSSAASSASLSPSLPTASSPTVPSSSSPSPSTNGGWSTNKLQLFQVVLAPAAAALMLVF